MQRLKSEVNQLTSEKLQIDSDLQQRNKLEEDKAKLLSENDQYDKEITVHTDCIIVKVNSCLCFSFFWKHSIKHACRMTFELSIHIYNMYMHLFL